MSQVAEMTAAIERQALLDALYSKLRTTLQINLPERALITCGWTSRAARGPISRRLPADVSVGEWQHDPFAEAFVSIHPERFRSVEEVAMAMLYGMGRAAYGKRRGQEKVGLTKTDTGQLTYTNTALGFHVSLQIANIVSQLGALPAGFAEVPPPRKLDRSRMRKYVCKCGFIIRTASDTAVLSHSNHGRMQLDGKQMTVAA